jgi:hypothetical protein
MPSIGHWTVSQYIQRVIAIRQDILPPRLGNKSYILANKGYILGKKMLFYIDKINGTDEKSRRDPLGDGPSGGRHPFRCRSVGPLFLILCRAWISDQSAGLFVGQNRSEKKDRIMV